MGAVDRMKKIIAFSSSHGCFGKGTPIRLFDGSIKNVEDVEIGDILMGDDSTPRKVLELKRAREELFEFEYIDGIKHVYNKSHDLVLQYSQTAKSNPKRYKGKTRIIKVSDFLALGKQHQRVLCKYNENVYREENKTLRIPPYILGMWLGDGTSSKPELTNIDKVLINSWYGYAESIGAKVTVRSNKSYNIVTQRGKDNPFLKALQYYFLINNKHIPLSYFNSSIEQRLDLIAGLIDTDGYLDPRGKCSYEITQKNKELAYDLFYLVRSCGIHSTIKKVRKTCINNGVSGWYYRINITRQIEKIPCRVSYKKAEKIDNPQRITSRVGVRNVKSLGVGVYYGFVLDKNHLFLHADGTVLKNTGKSSSVHASS